MSSFKIIPLSEPADAEISVPGSKSYTNRALMIAAMTKGHVKITRPLISEDTEAMLSCLKVLGVEIKPGEGFIEVRDDVSVVDDGDSQLDADISGTTIRFMAALCAVLPGRQVLGGKPGLNKRPIGDLVDGLRQLGANISYLDKEGYPPLRIDAPKLSTQPVVKLNGTVSSQYLSAILMVAPLIGGLIVEVTGELVSKPFVEMTIETMARFGVHVSNEGSQRFDVGSAQSYKATDYSVEGDISSASYFFAVAALTGSSLTVRNANPSSKQADMDFLRILEGMGNQVTDGDNQITLSGKTVLPIEVNMQTCPDQAQTLAVLAAFAEGTTRITGIRSLRVKETERISALEAELAKMGIKTESTDDSLTIHGGQPSAASIATYGDHRMAMAFAVAGSKLPGMVIEQPAVVAKTYPDFWADLNKIGISTEDVSL